MSLLSPQNHFERSWDSVFTDEKETQGRWHSKLTLRGSSWWHTSGLSPGLSFPCVFRGFPGSSAGKRIHLQCRRPWFDSWVGKILWRRDSYTLQYSWASLVAQMIKNLPAMRETWVQSLGWEDPREEGVATHSSILVWRISMDRGVWQITVHGVAKSRT